MAAIKGKDTKPELLVRRLVHRLGYRYRLHQRNMPGRPDLVFRSRRKVIFVHGCFWHMHDCRYGRVTPSTNAAFWNEKRMANMERDRKTQAVLRADGWNCQVVWECETRNLPALEKVLLAFLEELSCPSSAG